MANKSGMVKYAAHVGLWPSDPTYRTYWETKLTEAMQAMQAAAERKDVRLVRLYSGRVKEAKSILCEVMA